MSQRNYSLLDKIVNNVDQSVTTLFGNPLSTGRMDPAKDKADQQMKANEKDLSARLMRINHTGEVCAQALYQGQAMTAQLQNVKENMNQAAAEENDHLIWCKQRIKELNSHTSYLDPLWYAGSYAIGATAGKIGDKWSLGFVAETENQVVKHLEGHLNKISSKDEKSRAIIEQMKKDELKHASNAIKGGGMPLPKPVKKLMQMSAKVMTTTVFWV